MSKKVDYPYNREIAKKANEKLDNIEVFLCFSFFFSLTLVIVLQSAIPLYCGIAILVIYTIWCFKYVELPPLSVIS